MQTLTGSEKQIAWAERIRASKLEEIDRFVASIRARGDKAVASGEISRADADAAIAAEIDPAVAAALAQTSAAWWIDHRDTRAQVILRDATQ